VAAPVAEMLAPHYIHLHQLHVACVALSGTLFASRALLRIATSPLATHRAVRVASYVIDTALLVAGILLTLTIHQYPFVNGWLTAKVLLLPCYIALGLIALRLARTTFWRIAATLGAVLVYGAMIVVAVTHGY
jgi:uncharacterized membrane protein SirB2